MADKFEQLTQREISATTRWGVGLLVTIFLQAAAIFFWAATLQAQVEQNTKDVVKLDIRVSTIDSDIRDILVGIGQIKQQLGIIEK